jgi:hypothetical protein
MFYKYKKNLKFFEKKVAKNLVNRNKKFNFASLFYQTVYLNFYLNS